VLRGAADTVIKISRKDDKLQIINRAPEGKQKDADEFATIKLRAQKVSYIAETAERSTLVLMVDDDPIAQPARHENKPGGPAEAAVLAALRQTEDWRGVTWLAAQTGKDNKTVARAAVNLTAKGLLVKKEGPPQSWRVCDVE
jgi:hypothetical protein